MTNLQKKASYTGIATASLSKEFVPLSTWDNLKQRLFNAAGIQSFPHDIIVVHDREEREAPFVNDQDYVENCLQQEAERESLQLRSLLLSKLRSYRNPQNCSRAKKINREMKNEYLQKEDLETNKKETLLPFLENELAKIEAAEQLYAGEGTAMLCVFFTGRYSLNDINALNIQYRTSALIAGDMKNSDDYRHLNPLRWEEASQSPKENRKESLDTLLTALSPLINCEYDLIRKARLLLTDTDAEIERLMLKEGRAFTWNFLGGTPHAAAITPYRRQFNDLPEEKKNTVLNLVRAWHGPASDKYIPEVFFEELLGLEIYSPGLVERDELVQAVDAVRLAVAKLNPEASNDRHAVTNWIKRLQERLPHAFTRKGLAFLNLDAGLK